MTGRKQTDELDFQGYQMKNMFIQTKEYRGQKQKTNKQLWKTKPEFLDIKKSMDEFNQ